MTSDINAHLATMIAAFRGRKVLVIGEAMLDTYLEGSTHRLCREAPVPIVDLSRRKDVPGGAANTAVNLRTLGAEVTFLSAIGDDEAGERLRHALAEQGVWTEHLIVRPGRATLAKTRVVADDQLLVRFDQGSTEDLEPPIERQLITRLADYFDEADAVVVSDYGYGILTTLAIRTLANLQARRGRVLVVDSRQRLPKYRHCRATAVKPNYAETVALLGLPKYGEGAGRIEQVQKHGDAILELSGARIAAVTMDTDGAWIFERGNPPYRTFARPMRQSRAAGAGDTYTAALALALASGAPPIGAAEVASAAAAVVVGKEGTASCSQDELAEAMTADVKQFGQIERLTARLELHRQQGQRLVFTNGCFDILHRGHVTYLNRAKSLGDILIVGVNTDSSVRRLKGPTRPINSLEDRVGVLSALSCIDYIVAFDDDTPCELVRQVRPDIFVKGGDYTRERLPEADIVESYGGRVEILPFLDNRSTTRIIARIQETDSVDTRDDVTSSTGAHYDRIGPMESR